MPAKMKALMRFGSGKNGLQLRRPHPSKSKSESRLDVEKSGPTTSATAVLRKVSPLLRNKKLTKKAKSESRLDVEASRPSSSVTKALRKITPSLRNKKSKGPHGLKRAKSEREVFESKQKARLRKEAAKKSFYTIKNIVKELKQGSPFLKTRTPRGNRVALFLRKEIVLGEYLGEGSFCCAYKVAGFNECEFEEGSTGEETMLQRKCGLGFLDRSTYDEKRRDRKQVRTNLRERNGNHKYAIKFLKHELIKSKDFESAVADLVMEANFMCKFNHPNILKIRGMALGGISALASGRHDSYFVMTDELEETLSQRIERWYSGKLQDEWGELFKLQLGLQIADALRYLHNRRLVYRDLKPENVGISGSRVQIFDFGFCRELPEKRQGEVVDGERLFRMTRSGSPRYMAPEVVLSHRYNTKADVYSWSMTMYEVLSLKPPFTDKTVEDHAVDVCMNGERPPLHGHPFFIRHILGSTWEQDICERLTMEQLCEKLKKHVEERTIYTSPEQSHEENILKYLPRQLVESDIKADEESDIESVLGMIEASEGSSSSLSMFSESSSSLSMFSEFEESSSFFLDDEKSHQSSIEDRPRQKKPQLPLDMHLEREGTRFPKMQEEEHLQRR